jgi:hypothetical protein
MKSLILVAAAGAATAANLDGVTTEDLEASTREFMVMNDIAPYSRRKLQEGLRYSTRSARLGNNGSKSGKENNGGKSGKSGIGPWDDDDRTLPSDVSICLQQS